MFVLCTDAGRLLMPVIGLGLGIRTCGLLILFRPRLDAAGIAAVGLTGRMSALIRGSFSLRILIIPTNHSILYAFIMLSSLLNILRHAIPHLFFLLFHIFYPFFMKFTL
jgi:hypothetical protein